MRENAETVPTVLVVEDEPRTRAQVSQVLQETGLNVIEAENAGAAWTAIEAGQHLHVVVADLDLPDAPDLARRVHERQPVVGVVVMSRKIHWLAPNEVPGDGCFLPKPFPADTLVREVWCAVLGAC